MGESARDQAAMMMSRIRHQIFTPDVTTMGVCPRCHSTSRGAGVCAECVGIDLDALLSSVAGSSYVRACRDQRWAENRVLEKAEGDDECG